MKVMVVGGGGREHAIIKKLKENSSITAIFALPGNGGMEKDATCVNIGATDLDGIIDFAKNSGIVEISIPIDNSCIQRRHSVCIRYIPYVRVLQIQSYRG